ncbi:MarR family winged helix-turn-helix transcriptional regulator [Jatrophihabitans sp. DSM 45814]
MRTNSGLARGALSDAALVSRAATSLAARARAQRRGALSLNQVAVLGWLLRAGPMTPGEVASRLRLQPQSLTRTLNKLEEADLAQRNIDPSDGRQSLLTITASGRKSLRDEMRPRNQWLATAMSETLTEAERKSLVLAAGLMQRLAEVDASLAPEGS